MQSSFNMRQTTLTGDLERPSEPFLPPNHISEWKRNSFWDEDKNSYDHKCQFNQLTILQQHVLKVWEPFISSGLTPDCYPAFSSIHFKLMYASFVIVGRSFHFHLYFKLDQKSAALQTLYFEQNLVFFTLQLFKVCIHFLGRPVFIPWLGWMLFLLRFDAHVV